MPALMAAREAARRTLCRNNLKQIAAGLQMYYIISDGFVPGAPHRGQWSNENTSGAITDPVSNLYIYRDPKTRNNVQVHPTGYNTCAATHLQGMSAGMKYYSPKNARAFVKGDINQAPVNLGLLLGGGMVPDGSVFFCPSAEGMPELHYWEGPGGYVSWTHRGNAMGYVKFASSCEAVLGVREMKKLGGTDADSMLRGDWSWTKNFQWIRPGIVEKFGGSDPVPGYPPGPPRPDPGENRGLFSHYMFRLMPTIAIRAEWSENPPYIFGHIPVGTVMTLRATRPKVKFTAFEPYMSNERQIKGRAIAYDSRGMTYGYWNVSWWGEMVWPGYAWWAHREGYNVPFGDHSVRWYSDPQGTIMYWPKSNGGTYGNLNMPRIAENADQGFGAVYCDGTDPYSDNSWDRYYRNARLVAHIFDQWAGMDTGLNDDSDF